MKRRRFHPIRGLEKSSFHDKEENELLEDPNNFGISRKFKRLKKDGCSMKFECLKKAGSPKKFKRLKKGGRDPKHNEHFGGTSCGHRYTPTVSNTNSTGMSSGHRYTPAVSNTNSTMKNVGDMAFNNDDDDDPNWMELCDDSPREEVDWESDGSMKPLVHSKVCQDLLKDLGIDSMGHGSRDDVLIPKLRRMKEAIIPMKVADAKRKRIDWLYVTEPINHGPEHRRTGIDHGLGRRWTGIKKTRYGATTFYGKVPPKTKKLDGVLMVSGSSSENCKADKDNTAEVQL